MTKRVYYNGVRFNQDRHGNLTRHVPEPMTVAARARLEARAEVDRWRTSWGRLWARIGVEQMRPVARRFLDRIATPGVTQGDLLGVALIDYKLRFPQARGDRLIVGRPAIPRSDDRFDVRDAMGMADYHCRFCGRKLNRGPKGIAVHPPHVEEHARICAVNSLAGTMTTVPPGWNPADPERVRECMDRLVSIVKAIVLAWASDVVDPSMIRFSNLELDL